MSQRSGLLFTSLYLKQCSTCLIQYYAGSSKEVLNKQSGPFVQLSKASIPTIIPPGPSLACDCTS